MGLKGMDGLAQKMDRPPLGPIKAIDTIEEAGLSCSVWPNKRKDLMGLYIKVQSLQGTKPSKTKPEILNF
jgi:hypothetical protein